MKLIFGEKTLERVFLLDEFWLHDLHIPKEIILSDYTDIMETMNIDLFTLMIGYWLDENSNSELNKESVLHFIKSITELDNDLCSPELLYYQFNGKSIIDLSIGINDLKFIDNIYEIDLKKTGADIKEFAAFDKNAGLLHITEKEDVKYIREQLSDLYDEEEEEYIDDVINLTSGSYPMFQTLEDRKKMYSFIESTVNRIKKLHYPDVETIK